MTAGASVRAILLASAAGWRYPIGMTEEMATVILTGVGVLLGVWWMLAYYEIRKDTAHVVLAKRTDTVRTELGARFDSVHADFSARLDAVHSGLNARIDSAHSELSGRIDSVNGRLDALLHELTKRG